VVFWVNINWAKMEKVKFSIRNISKAFDGVNAVNNFSFSWNDYKIVGLIGPNGAGKTTLFNILTGFIRADSGQFIFREKNLLNLPPNKIVHKGIVRTFQDLRLLRQIKVIENIMLYQQHQVGEDPLTAWIRGTKYQKNQNEKFANAKSILEFVGLWDKRNELAEALSYGQQKLLSLGCCLAAGGEYLILDEPFSGINPETINHIINMLQDLVKQGKKIFLIEHNIRAVRSICDWLVVMDEGKKIAEGIPDEVLRKEEIIEAYLD